jgi:hypothetical protein
MAWNKRIEALRTIVLWECKDIPPDLVLALIKHESAGYVGRKAGVACKPGVLHDAAGNSHTVNHALGLMQTIPATIDWYNQSAPANEKATFEDMTGTDERAARLQTRIGCKFLAFVNHYLHKKMPEAAPAASLSEASPDQIKLALTGFAVGHGATLKKLKAVKALGVLPSFEAIKANFPGWGKNSAGKWINRPIKFAEVVFDWYRENKTGSIDIPKPVEIVKRTVSKVNGKGAFVAVAFLAGAGWLLTKYYSKPRGNHADT